MGMAVRIVASNGQDRDLRSRCPHPSEVERAGRSMMRDLDDLRPRREPLLDKPRKAWPLKIGRKQERGRAAFQP